jgi:hypothetical protein
MGSLLSWVKGLTSLGMMHLAGTFQRTSPDILMKTIHFFNFLYVGDTTLNYTVNAPS